MSDVTLIIDRKKVVAREGMTLVEAAKSAGIDIPTLCHDERLKPAGDCRICMVEIQKGKRTRLVASCVYPVEEGLVVTTDNPKIRKIRKMIIELLWPSWTRLSRDYGVAGSRFVSGHPDCSQCGLCIRYCREVAKKDVLYWHGRGVDRKLAFLPGAGNECAGCRQCFSLCTGGWITQSYGFDTEDVT